MAALSERPTQLDVEKLSSADADCAEGMEEESPALFPTPSPHAQGPEASATKRGEGMATDTDALATPGPSMISKGGPPTKTTHPSEQKGEKQEEQVAEILLPGRWHGGAGAAAADRDAVVDFPSVAS
eukprot:CAMPEP_0114285952 /NCGR_PEP_ID=MMETSP0059-20121206/5489_1 /TAXON_ID=36894 /ORGANISM="Pyramimonas parkeae, Strain CCMP726" /LENGTH=126 /DNA_ID=CAMNT_0001406941 /DNA_START=229 /DNA_END=605 /DNA_ORIENTATION=-